MRMVHPKITKEIEWNENVHIWEFVIENPKFLRNILKDLSQHTESRELNLVTADESLDFGSKLEVIVNPFVLNFNNKRAMITLMKIINKTAIGEELYTETTDIKSKILRYMSDVIDASQFDFEVDTSDFLTDALAKAVNVHIIGDDDDFVELLTDYLVMMRDLVGTKLFCFTHLRTLMDDTEMTQFIKNILNHQLDLLLIESASKPLLPDTKRLIIDGDLCEI